MFRMASPVPGPMTPLDSPPADCWVEEPPRYLSLSLSLSLYIYIYIPPHARSHARLGTGQTRT